MNKTWITHLSNPASESGLSNFEAKIRHLGTPCPVFVAGVAPKSAGPAAKAAGICPVQMPYGNPAPVKCI